MLSDEQVESSKAWREVLSSLARHAEKEGQLPAFLLAMAQELQSELAHYRVWKDVPHAKSLEFIMRAVMAAIKNDPEMGRYIGEKIDQGVPRLLAELGLQTAAAA